MMSRETLTTTHTTSMHTHKAQFHFNSTWNTFTSHFSFKWVFHTSRMWMFAVNCGDLLFWGGFLNGTWKFILQSYPNVDFIDHVYYFCNLTLTCIKMLQDVRKAT